MNEKLKIRIFPDGTIKAETKGIKGEKCTDYIMILEKMLEAEATEANYTEEFYESENINMVQNQTSYVRNQN